MKYFIMITLAAAFYYKDVVTVIDDSSFYFKCRGEVINLNKDGTYQVVDLCEGVEENMKADQLKLIRRRK